MRRLGFAFVVVAAGLAWAAIDRSSVRAAGKELQGGAGSEEGPAKRIDEAIQAYENRANQELEHTRSEITRLQKELGELVELQFSLGISVAELQAEMRAQQLVEENEANGQGQGQGSGGGNSASKRDEDRRRLRAIELNRELRGVLENLRNVATQKRNEIDQLVIQLRNLRTQQRQMAADEAERKKQQSAPKPEQE